MLRAERRVDPSSGGRAARSSDAGLRALAEAVAAVLAGVVPAPAGPLLAAAEVLTPDRPGGGRPSAGSGGAAVPPTGRPGERIDAAHAEIWGFVERAQAGDGEAFGELYDRYFDVVYRYIFYRVRDRELAEDLTQEAFVRALRRITTISYQGRDIGAWFVTIARNLVLDHVKSARHRLEIVVPEVAEPDRKEPSTESTVVAKLDRDTLLGAVEKLNEEQRECIVLRFLQGFSVAETAAVMDRNDGAVKAMQHRAVRKLADLLGGLLDE